MIRPPHVIARDQLREAITLVIRNQFASELMLFHSMKIPMIRAEALLQMMEGYFLVGPADGADPRRVLCTPDQLDMIVADIFSDNAATGESEDGR